MSTLMDSYSESNRDSARVVYGTSSGGAGQVFQWTSANCAIDYCQFYLTKTSTPTGTAYAELWDVTGDYGSSAYPMHKIATSTGSLDVSTLDGTYALKTFTFTEDKELENGHWYAIVFAYTGGSATNYVNVGYDGSTPSHSGNHCYMASALWYAHSGGDTCFYVYGKTPTYRWNDTYAFQNHSAVGEAGTSKYPKLAQSIPWVLSGYKLTHAQFSLAKVGSPTGTAVATLYAHSGSYGTSSVPTGAALATSGTFDVSTLSSSIRNVVTFTFTDNYVPTNGTNYCIAIEYSGGDASNYITSSIDSTAPSHGGNYSRYLVASGWSAVSGGDMCFAVYGELASSVKTITGLARTSVKSIDGLLIASSKTWAGLA